MDEMASLGEIVERLARESERKTVEIEALKSRIAELEKALAAKG